jgi:hypothetical protein
MTKVVSKKPTLTEWGFFDGEGDTVEVIDENGNKKEISRNALFVSGVLVSVEEIKIKQSPREEKAFRPRRRRGGRHR